MKFLLQSKNHFFIVFSIVFILASCQKESFEDYNINESTQIESTATSRQAVPVIPENQNTLEPFIEKEVILEFTGANGDLLEAYFLLPQNNRSVYNFVILLHGSGGALDGSNDNTNSYSNINSFTSQYTGWVNTLLGEDYGVMVINSFKSPGRVLPQNENDYIGVKPPNDGSFSPYRVRAEDVKAGLDRLHNLRDVAGADFVGEVALLGFSHGATTAISAIHDYTRTKVTGVDEMQDWSVKTGGVEYDSSDYDAPFSDQNIDIAAAVAYYGGTYGYGYFTDYDENNTYKYYLNKPLLIHHGTADKSVRIGTESQRFRPRGFKKHVNDGNKKPNTEFVFQEWLGAGHSFDNPNKNGADDTNARNGAKTQTLDFLDSYIGY